VPAAAAAEAIDMAPVGELPAHTLEALAARLSRETELPCHVAPGLDDPVAPLPGRDQLDAGALLAALEARAADGRLLVGVAGADIAIPVFTFVFGLARQGGPACLVSLARADPSFYGLPADAGLRDARVVAEIRHELGHLASLEHCLDHGCLMSFAGSIERADARGAVFCGACRERLPGWLRGDPRQIMGGFGGAKPP
jgi:archaemetzincin